MGKQMKVSNKDFAAAKSAAKKIGHGDHSAQHSAAMRVLSDRCPAASEELIADMAWQAVLAARP